MSGWLKDCIYKDKDKVDLAKQAIKPVFDAYVEEIKIAPPSSISIQPFNGLSGKAMQAFKDVNLSALFQYNIMKDTGFDEEYEIRLSATVVNNFSDGDLIRFRDGKNGKVPYVEIPIGIRRPIPSLQRIVVGPSEQKDQRAALLRLLLQQIGLSKVKVVSSKNPYRNW